MTCEPFASCVCTTLHRHAMQKGLTFHFWFRCICKTILLHNFNISENKQIAQHSQLFWFSWQNQQDACCGTLCIFLSFRIVLSNTEMQGCGYVRTANNWSQTLSVRHFVQLFICLFAFLSTRSNERFISDTGKFSISGRAKHSKYCIHRLSYVCCIFFFLQYMAR